MDRRYSDLKRHTLYSRSANLSPAKRALLEKRKQGRLLRPNPSAHAPIERVARNQELPLSFLLEDVLEEIGSNPGFDAGALSTCFRLTGAFNEAAIEATVNELARRHEALRTSFPRIDGRPAQVINPPTTIKLAVVDMQDVPEARRLEEALKMLAVEERRPYHPSQVALWRVLLVRLDKNEHLLLLSVSHLIADGASLNILIEDCLTLYQAFSTGEASRLRELPIQFADYAYWQRKTLQGKLLEDLTSYWKRQLDGLKLVPQIRLPFERLPEQSERTLETQLLEVPEALLEGLKELARRERVTLFMLLFAGLITVLHRYTGRDDFGILSPVANRHRPETRGVVGWFADYIVLRVRLSGIETFAELLQHVRNVVLEANEHQDLPFFKFYGNSSKVWNEASAYSSVRFNMALESESREPNAPPIEAAALMPGLVLNSIEVPQPTRKTLSPPGLAVFVRCIEKELKVTITHELERHEASAISDLLQNYLLVLEGAAVLPRQRLEEFPFYLPSSMTKILARG